MVSEMIERLGRAVFDQWCNRTLAERDRIWALAGVQEPWLKCGRAVLEAIRDPSEQMLKGEGVHPNCGVCGGHLEGWQAMIEAALK